MGRIAHISKRGNLWWYRRRHPAISLKQPQNPHEARVSSMQWTTVQARGHVAVSLQTTCSREARRTAAMLTDLLERAWASIEGQIAAMTEEEQNELVDEAAVVITQNLRRAVDRFRLMPLQPSDAVRAKAFQIVAADLQAAFGLGSDAHALPAPLLTPQEAHKGEAYAGLPDGGLNQSILDLLTDEDFENLARINLANGDLYTGVPDAFLIQQFEGTMIGLAEMLDQYLKACDRSGLNPATAMPAFAELSTDYLRTAARIGLKPVTGSSGTTAKGKPVRTDEMFSALASRYLDLRSRGFTLRREDETSHAATGENFVRTSLRNYQASVKIFVEIVGDLAVSKIGKDEVVLYNEMVQKLPANYGKSSRDKRIAREIIENEDEAEVKRIDDLREKLEAANTPPREIDEDLAKARTERISATTVKRHQTALQSIFEFALSEGLVQRNPFKGRVLTEAEVKRRRKTEARVLRTDWGDHINVLLASEVFTKPLDELDEPLFWMPLIAMFAGLRMEEICQLRLADFATEDGIPYLAVQNANGTQNVKSENGFRKVPLHQALVEIGILDLVRHQKDRGLTRLFPNLPRSQSKGTLSAIMSKRFGYYIRSRGIKEAGLDFHALRTDFQHRLTRKKVPKHVRSGLMGHEQDDVTSKNYFREGELMPDLLEYVNRITINVSKVQKPFAKARAHSVETTDRGFLRVVKN